MQLNRDNIQKMVSKELNKQKENGAVRQYYEQIAPSMDKLGETLSEEQHTAMLYIIAQSLSINATIAANLAANIIESIENERMG